MHCKVVKYCILSEVCRGGSRISFRRRCTRLLLLTSTPINQYIFFFWKNTSCIRKPQVISGGGGGGPPPPPPPRSAPVQALGTEGQRDLRRDSLAQAFKKHPYGREYAVMTHEEATKNHPGGAKRSFKIII